MNRITLLALPFAFLAASCGTSTPAPDGFAQTVSALSGPGGYFDTDNLISNESSYLHAISDLRAAGIRGSAYLGVGPGQNFSYIAEIDPEIAIIVDIRRDNVLQHLIYKAAFEASVTREQYLAILLGRPAPSDPAELAEAPIEAILEGIEASPSTEASRTTARREVLERIRGFGFSLVDGDLETVGRFHDEMIAYGLDLRFRSHGRAPQFYYPTLRRLILEVDREGEAVSYLSTNERFQRVRQLQLDDRIIPVVGDLAGDVALPAIGAFLTERGLSVSAFYTSNVEYYLFGRRTFGRFVENLRILPLTDESVIIKSFFPGGFRGEHPLQQPGYYSTQLVQRALGLVDGWDAGGYRDYWSIVTRDLVGATPAPTP
ncbi:MAG: hypothetical protein R3195_04765 [Gemmatimonadota bacterium]|nr:hypothetical protein [Gemmatimonadota bacterium]